MIDLPKPSVSTRTRVETALRDEFVFAVERHSALLTALGLPTSAAGFGYAYLAEGDRPEPGDEDVRLVEIE